MRASWEVAYFANNPYGGMDALNNGRLSHFHLPPVPTLIYLGARYYLNYLNGVSLVEHQAETYTAGQPSTEFIRGTIQSDGKIRVVVTVLLERFDVGSRLRQPIDVVLQP